VTTAPHNLDEAADTDGRAHGWTTARVVAGAAFLAAGLWAGRGAWEDIFRIATRDEESSHIWLVPFLCGWLVYMRRASFRSAAAAPAYSFLGPVLVAIGWAMAHWGFNGAKQSPLHVGALLVALGAMITVFGVRALMAVWPAVLLLAFIVPVPGLVRQQISIPLEQVTARATASLLSLGGLPIERSANVITINDHPVTVAEACNGLRMVFPLVMIVYVFCFTLPLRASVRWLLMLTSPISAVACNILRLIPTVYLYGYAKKQTGDVFHEYSGWVMLPIAFMVLWGLIRLLEALGFAVTTRKPVRASVKDQSPSMDLVVGQGVASC